MFEDVRRRYPNIGRATVYRVLNRLADRGEIRKVSIPNTADRFDFRVDDHVHLHCTSATEYLIWMTTAWSAVSEIWKTTLKSTKRICPEDLRSPKGIFRLKEYAGNAGKGRRGNDPRDSSHMIL